MTVSFYDLPPEVQCLIFGYTAGVELVQVASLFRLIVPIGSKYLLYSLHEYVQRTSFEIIQTKCKDMDARARAMAWACRKRIKLSKCHFVFKDTLELCIVEYVLRCCDVSNMESFGFEYVGELALGTGDHRVRSTGVSILPSIIAMKQGFPFEVAYKHDQHGLSRENLMERIVDLLVFKQEQDATNHILRTVSLRVDLHRSNLHWMFRLLQQIKSIEELHVYGCSGWRELDLASNIQKLLAVVGHLPNLKRLEIKTNMKRMNSTNGPAAAAAAIGRETFRLCSASLEELWIHQSDTLLLDECVCPNLRLLCLPLSYESRLVHSHHHHYEVDTSERREGSLFPYGMKVEKVREVIPHWEDAYDVCVHYPLEARPIRGFACCSSSPTCRVLFIPNAAEVSYDGDYFGSDSQDEDYEYWEDSGLGEVEDEEEDDIWEDDDDEEEEEEEEDEDYEDDDEDEEVDYDDEDDYEGEEGDVDMSLVNYLEGSALLDGYHEDDESL